MTGNVFLTAFVAFPQLQKTITPKQNKQNLQFILTVGVILNCIGEAHDCHIVRSSL